ncbi:lysophospholipid acyltransferase family protein [Pseudobacteriovorax antillogorgiicola]|uniref:KDO2-lipid IV(A) lauroyltransferase n=1 Tax=Pseudobacteriovorax antillogorgiicola TaxID=1513793 RepID=A0A1Y6C2W4_9BACT|nr:lysophospholipid acyltransferase family protein [Pseudobacteriovorax antillogorgiicola]TCS50697.1 KDO2-lipid IV(A) lauroyltransferase [Pseudobacteriovorax antillogorgiicola]SMF40472.1 KDO2-lipid IV(A) lauroyltransferase [Pseudobacteriovorax antillogorgiicola]
MYVVMSLFAALLSAVPASWLDRIAGGLATLCFDILRLRRALVVKNLEIALGDVYEPHERLAIARDSYKNFVLTAFEFIRSKYHDISANVDIQGEENLRQALEQGQGVYILCFHLGNWEAMGSYITRNIAPAHVLVKKVGGGGMNRFVEENREHNEFLWVKRQKKGDGFKAIVDILDRNEIVGFVMDQARPGEPRLPFFGTPAKTNTSFAAIWQRRQAPIVPAFMHRKSVGKHVLEVMPAINLETSDNTEQDILDHSVLFNKEVEKAVRKYPDHYFWLHNRWKS